MAGARAATASYTPDQRRPYALTGTIVVQRLLANDYTLEARYVYTKGVHLYTQERINVASPITASVNIPTYFSTPTAAQLAGDTRTLGSAPEHGGTRWYP